jgi:hypothetical protein
MSLAASKVVMVVYAEMYPSATLPAAGPTTIVLVVMVVEFLLIAKLRIVPPVVDQPECFTALVSRYQPAFRTVKVDGTVALLIWIVSVLDVDPAQEKLLKFTTV